MKVGLKDLQNLTRRLYLKLGYPEAQTETIVDVLSYAHRRGNFQSLMQEVAVGTPRFYAKREIAVEKETSLSYLIDAGGNIGICALRLAADLLVSKARRRGFAIVGMYNSSPPGTGPAGYYAEKIAREGFVGVVFCGSSKMVAPSGSSERAFGSNPVAIGIPTGAEPMVLDMATSAMPVFKVAEALIKGEMLSPNVGYDAEGVPTRDPTKILGSGALLTGGCLPGDPDNQNWGNLALAIDPDLLVGRESFLKNVDRTIAYIKGLKRTDPNRDIRLPGELSFIRSEQAIATQEVEINEDLFCTYRERILSRFSDRQNERDEIL
jgi:LDH2 family malate/lactate/ureidoglycolate dehydrogenase